MASQDETERLQRMIDDLRRMREHCEPKSNQNPVYLRYSNAVSAMKWIIENSGTESRAD
jgi:signal transduction histidine kinase